MIISDSILDEVLARATIADVLDFAGIAPPQSEKKNIRCPLPEHADSEPSFSIQKSGRGWKCFGCGRFGGVVDLVLVVRSVKM
jgi:DNA primase